MKKHSKAHATKARAAKRPTKRRARARSDAQLRDFEARDLGSDIRRSGSARLIRPKAFPTSLVLDAELVRQLREKGAKRGLGYQTMLKLIVREHLHEY